MLFPLAILRRGSYIHMKINKNRCIKEENNMSLISKLINTVFGAPDAAISGSPDSTRFLFMILSGLLIAEGILMIVTRKPMFHSLNAYTEQSVEKAVTLLGAGDIILACFNLTVGVLDMNTVPGLVIYVSAGSFMAMYLAVMTVFYGKLEKVK